MYMILCNVVFHVLLVLIMPNTKKTYPELDSWAMLGEPGGLDPSLEAWHVLDFPHPQRPKECPTEDDLSTFNGSS